MQLIYSYNLIVSSKIYDRFMCELIAYQHLKLIYVFLLEGRNIHVFLIIFEKMKFFWKK